LTLAFKEANTITPEFWKEEQQEGAQAFLEKRKPAFSRFRKRRV
jgi:1,4-dihydroxy-2-naphthoyl-CoA synthase